MENPQSTIKYCTGNIHTHSKCVHAHLHSRDYRRGNPSRQAAAQPSREEAVVAVQPPRTGMGCRPAPVTLSAAAEGAEECNHPCMPTRSCYGVPTRCLVLSAFCAAEPGLYAEGYLMGSWYPHGHGCHLVFHLVG